MPLRGRKRAGGGALPAGAGAGPSAGTGGGAAATGLGVPGRRGGLRSEGGGLRETGQRSGGVKVESAIQRAIRSSRAYYCLECGKCTAVCPIALRNPEVSPRRTVEEMLLGEGDGLLSDELLWSCLTCLRCGQVCPSGVAYADFIRDLRVEARRAGQEGLCTHGQAIQAWMRMMTEPDLRQNRLDWLDEGLKTSADSDTVYFVGCLPYYDVLFRRIGAQGVEIARAVVKILNHLGIEPQILPDERCCGHDLLWEGDVAHFRPLAELNSALLRATGARRIVTACPECARTLKVDYPAYVDDLGMEVVHISQLLADLKFDARPERSRRVGSLKFEKV
ncbi:MAG TPA: (Fe-S)-binding protein, partial [Anaerolineae bacterium]|nr:(Fe-S)-binding protein [Anaerolineae bacterium]